MPDWNQLHHAYGPAEDIPELLEALAPDPEDDVWEELWSSLCHQGTVYTASFAALPALENAARQWHPRERLQPLMLAGAIVASDDVQCDRYTHVKRVVPAILSLEQLARESLAAPGWSREDFIYLLQAALALEGDFMWGKQLNYLAEGEFPAVCPECEADLYLTIGAGGFYATLADPHRNSEAVRMEIRPADGDRPESGETMRRHALAAGQHGVADWIPYLFGTSQCPGCKAEFSVEEAIGILVR